MLDWELHQQETTHPSSSQKKVGDTPSQFHSQDTQRGQELENTSFCSICLRLLPEVWFLFPTKHTQEREQRADRIFFFLQSGSVDLSDSNVFGGQRELGKEMGGVMQGANRTSAHSRLERPHLSPPCSRLCGGGGGGFQIVNQQQLAALLFFN